MFCVHVDSMGIGTTVVHTRRRIDENCPILVPRRIPTEGQTLGLLHAPFHIEHCDEDRSHIGTERARGPVHTLLVATRRRIPTLAECAQARIVHERRLPWPPLADSRSSTRRHAIRSRNTRPFALAQSFLTKICQDKCAVNADTGKNTRSLRVTRTYAYRGLWFRLRHRVGGPRSSLRTCLLSHSLRTVMMRHASRV